MKMIDIILILALAAVLIPAVLKVIRTRKSGGCGCGCAGCTKACPSRSGHGQKTE